MNGEEYPAFLSQKRILKVREAVWLSGQCVGLTILQLRV